MGFLDKIKDLFSDEEEVVETEPVGLTLKEYEEQRKAKMSSLLGKKQPRTVEPIEGEKVKRVEEDYFVVRMERMNE